MSKTVEEEIKKLKAEVNYLKRYYHSNLKYIKLLWARMEEFEKENTKIDYTKTDKLEKNGNSRKELR